MSDTSEFRKPRPDDPIVTQSALYRKPSTPFKRPKGHRGKKPKGSKKIVRSRQDPNFLIIKARDEARRSKESAIRQQKVKEERYEREEVHRVEDRRYRVQRVAIEDRRYAEREVARIAERREERQFRTDSLRMEAARSAKEDRNRVSQERLYDQLFSLHAQSERRAGETEQRMVELIRSQEVGVDRQSFQRLEDRRIRRESRGRGQVSDVESTSESDDPHKAPPSLPGVRRSPSAEPTPRTQGDFNSRMKQVFEGIEEQESPDDTPTRLRKKEARARLVAGSEGRKLITTPRGGSTPRIFTPKVKISTPEFEEARKELGRELGGPSGRVRSPRPPEADPPEAVEGPAEQRTVEVEVQPQPEPEPVGVTLQKKPQGVPSAQKPKAKAPKAKVEPLLQDIDPESNYSKLLALGKDKSVHLFNEVGRAYGPFMKGGVSNPDHPIERGVETYDVGNRWVITDTAGKIKNTKGVSGQKGKKWTVTKVDKGGKAIMLAEHPVEGEIIVGGERQWATMKATSLDRRIHSDAIELDEFD